LSSPHPFPVDQHGRGVLIFRWIVFLVAAVYVVYQILWSADYSTFAGPFRFLTIWALLLSFFVASRNLAYSEHRSDRVWVVTVMVTAVLNAMVVALYWRLFLNDPSSVTAGDGPPPWHQQYYLHGIGPLLQWVDALFILGAFHRPWRAILPLVGVVAGYVVWVELVVSRFADTPTGSVTSGLPYLFLNSLELAGRAQFYATATVQALVVLGIFSAMGWGIARLRSRRRATP